MNRAALLIGIAAILQACAPQKASIDLGDVDDYHAFLQSRMNNEELRPFKAEPLSVSATGKVKVQPDIAVITAVITAIHKNESKAVDEVAGKVNAIQAALSDRSSETGFMGLGSIRKFDEQCLNANFLANMRQNEIRSDYYFNRSLDQRGDTETARRPDKIRLPMQVCTAQDISVSTSLVIRIKPADAAGNVLRILADAGAKNAQLFGYDFSNYDLHYQKAAEKAVEMARVKAETHARLTGTELGKITNFAVTRSSRSGRFGPQPNVIRAANRYRGASGSAVDRQVNNIQREKPVTYSRSVPALPSRVAHVSCWDGSVVSNGGSCPAQAMITCLDGTLVANAGYCPEPVMMAQNSIAFDAYSEDEITVTGAKVRSDVAMSNYGKTNTTNALSMTLLSGPQTIAVTANLSFDYKTPLDEKIIVKREN